MQNIKKSISQLVIFSSFMLICSACADKIVSENDVNPVVAPNLQLSRFSELQKRVFTPICAVPGCHLGSDSQANLDFSEGKSYANLINVKSLLFPSYNRVVPGNKDASLVYIAVTFSFKQLQMPLTGKLDQYIIDSIGVWIDKGALND